MSAARYFDAHNHFQDPRLDPWRESIEARNTAESNSFMVVNGTHEADWNAVADLARRCPWILPSFGYHPWYLERATDNWRSRLEHFLSEFPFAVGEIGIDHWKKGLEIPLQERMFLEQLELAKSRELPVTIHCINAWSRLLTLLGSVALPTRGFLLHSYAGPADLVEPFVQLGAYFSCPGYFLAERKRAQLHTFGRVPLERLLVETDAPDQILPDHLDRFGLIDPNGRRLNHPANIIPIYEGVAAALAIEPFRFNAQIELNFRALFGSR